MGVEVSDTRTRIALMLAVAFASVFFCACCICGMAGNVLAEANHGLPLNLVEERFPTAVLFSSEYPSEASLLLGAPGHARVRRHLEQDCRYADSPWTVALRRLQELLGTNAQSVVWLKHSSGGRSHIVGFYGHDVVVRPERNRPVVMTCGTDGTAVVRELRDLANSMD